MSRIIQLKAENFKRLKAVQIVPGDSSIVKITGANEAGKSSVLDAIMSVFECREVPGKPIRDGEKK